VRNSFNYYWEKWIAPYHGAYLHQGNFWPYAFELASCYVLLDQPERAKTILDWHLAHQTMPVVYAWGEQIDSTSLTFYAGDIPHGWVAADYINFIQHILCVVKPDSLMLGAGIPAEWLETGETIMVKRMPTYSGIVNFSMQFSETTSQIDWEIKVEADRIKGMTLKIPVSYEIISVTVDEKSWKKFGSGKIMIPATSQKVRAEITRYNAIEHK
jgi:hypothetical protein